MQVSSFQDAEPPAVENWPSRRLHMIVLSALVGLLILLLVGGILALNFLRQLQTAEHDLQHSLEERAQTMTSLASAVHLYNDRIQEYLVQDKASSNDFAQLGHEIEVQLRSYPAGRSSEEEQMLSALARQNQEQEQIVVQIFAWPREDRRRKALEYLRDHVIPKQLEILNTREKIALWNQQQLDASSNQQLEYFDQTRRKLTEFLVLALVAGILLTSGSLAYLLRLAGQARRSYRELARSREELHQLSARLVDAQEAERRSISRELHDEVGQSLGALLVDAGRLGAMLPPGVPGAEERLARIKAVAENTLQTVRDIALLLRPSMLDDLGLVAALEWQGREVERRSEAEVHVEAEGVSENLSEEYKTTIYRLVQEALHNAARHSGAKNINVTIRQSADRITVTVADDGKGFDPQHGRGMGILGMEERVKHLGGTITIDSSPGKGARLTFELPWRPNP